MTSVLRSVDYGKICAGLDLGCAGHRAGSNLSAVQLGGTVNSLANPFYLWRCFAWRATVGVQGTGHRMQFLARGQASFGSDRHVDVVSGVIRGHRKLEVCKMGNYLAVGVALALVAGCGNESEPKTAVPAPPVAATDAQPNVAPPRPAPPNAVDDGVQHPAPGQAGDHSSPAFKGGGQPDPQK